MTPSKPAVDLIAGLLERVFAEPAAVLDEVGGLLADAAPPLRCALLRVRGNACRELRRIDESVEHLRAAHNLAIELADLTLEAEAAMSLAATLSYLGDFDGALVLVGRSVEILDGDGRAVALSQRAGLLRRAGRYTDAEAAFTAAEAAAMRADDPTIIGDVWMNRGVMYGWAGDIDAAEADTQRALDVFEAQGWAKRAVDMQHNLAWLACRRGDLVEAFRRFDVAEARYRSLGMTGAAIFPDRCEALIAAGLIDEAIDLADASVAGLGARGNDVDLGEALMLAARAAMLRGHDAHAAAAADRATALFAAQGRDGWWAASTLLAVRARVRSGARAPLDDALVAQIVDATRTAGLSGSTTDALVLSAELALQDGQADRATAFLSGLDRATLGLATRCRADLVLARLLDARGLLTDAIDVCARGVREFVEATADLGGAELRASVAVHVAELVDLGLELALRDGDVDVVLEWTERQRASALDVPPVRPPADAELAHLLTELRLAATSLDEERAAFGRSDRLEQRCAVLRDEVRRRARHVRRSPPAPAVPSRLADVSIEADATWVSYVQSGDLLLAVVTEQGASRQCTLGRAADVVEEVTRFRSSTTMHLASFALRPARMRGALLDAAARAGEVLVDPLALCDGAVVISPTAGLHDVPWALLPALQQRPFVIAPSISVWRRCAAMPLGVPRSVTVIAGPGLGLADREAEMVAARYPTSTLLTGAAATVQRAGNALTGIDLAHIVCHGRFAASNPLFSSLELADGPMYVHDLERLDPPPRAAILSACSAGSSATPVGREILGLTASLLGSGLRWVIAATSPIPDLPDTVELMGVLHESLAAGASPSTALCAARRIDPILAATLACFGAG